MVKEPSALFESRLDSCRELLEQWNIDGLLVGSQANRRWLSGFSGSAGWLVVTEDKAILGTDFRYWDQARQQSPCFLLYKMAGSQAADWFDFLGEIQVNTLGVEARFITMDQYKLLDGISKVILTPVKETIESLRIVKSAAELDDIRRAAAITDATMNGAKGILKPGLSERRAAWMLEKRMRDLGAHSTAFPIIVASGPNAAMAHHEPGDRLLAAGDSIIIDMGANINGYNSDMTRSFHLGEEPDDQFISVYNLVLKAQEAAVKGIRAGITGGEADRLARSIIESGGFGAEFGHSLGHGVGLEVHENPRLTGKGESGPLSIGAVVTVEPGIYLSGWGGIRIEDLAIVADQGLEMLSHCPKDPYVPIN